MSEAFTALSTNSKSWDNYDLLLHLRFLVGFLIVAIASGWLSYKRMLRNESHL
jgi:ABC-2 type transport system permease protein